jgi:hypothetical protein
MYRTRKRVELLTHVQHTNGQDNLPNIGKTIADPATRVGVAERVPAPAVQQRLAIDLARSADDDQRRRDLAWAMVTTATPPDATTLDLRQTVPGLGKLLRLGLLDARHASTRVPRGQDCVSYCRLVPYAKASAGKR